MFRFDYVFFSDSSICTWYLIEVLFYSAKGTLKAGLEQSRVYDVKSHLQQQEVYEGSSYLQPCDNSRTIPLRERQSFPPRLLQQLMPREKRQTDNRGRDGEREEVGKRVRRLHFHSNRQTERLFMLSLAIRPFLLSHLLIRTNTCFF